MTRLTLPILACAILAAPVVLAAEPLPTTASVLAGPCTTCHGPDGSGSGAIPAIKGRPPQLLLEQLKGFRQGTQPSTVMGRLAKGYSDEQLALLANHFGDK